MAKGSRVRSAAPGAGATSRGGARTAVTVASWLTPKEPIPGSVYVAASAATVAALLGGWAFLSYGGHVRPEFLPAPHEVLRAAIELIGDGTLWSHITASCFVIFL